MHKQHLATKIFLPNSIRSAFILRSALSESLGTVRSFPPTVLLISLAILSLVHSQLQLFPQLLKTLGDYGKSLSLEVENLEDRKDKLIELLTVCTTIINTWQPSHASCYYAMSF